MNLKHELKNVRPAYWIALVAAIILLVATLSGCNKTAEDKINQQIKDNQHSLTADERPLATTNAKAYFEKEYPVETAPGVLTKVRGQFLECRPSDSNFNGLVTCKGLVPQLKGGYQEVTRYCGYRPELVGCSDVDTVGK